MIRLIIKKHDNDSIILAALKGIDHFGFGTFLGDLKPEEIEWDEFSKEVILKARHKSGLRGMEIWGDNRIAWGSLHHNIIMPISEISKEETADKWLKQIKIKE